MRVFFDTNVLVSAFATRGLCADLLRYVILEHELVTGEVVLVELRRVLRDKLRVPKPTLTEIDSFLRDQEIVAKPRKHLVLGLEDHEDEWIVASAVAANVDALVTGDAGVGALRNPPVRIVTPRGLWEMLRGPTPAPNRS